MVSLFVLKPFLAIREIAAAESKKTNKHAAICGLPRLQDHMHAFFSHMLHLLLARTPDVPHWCGLAVAGCTQLRSRELFFGR